MSDKHLKLEPHKIDPTTWWYETPKGIEIYLQRMGEAQIDCIKISWRKLRFALKRKDKE